ncbi:MAG: hypothetical protein WBB84_03895, partial [Candidatus Omnitrophota bacterium]
MLAFSIRNQKGSVMITAFVAIFALGILAVASVQRATTEYNLANRYRLSTEIYYVAEAGTEKVAYDLARKVADYEDEPAGATDSWDELQFTQTDYLGTEFDIDVTVESMDTDQTDVDPDGIITILRHYKITSLVTDTGSGISTTICQVVARKKRLTFQHAIFYAVDLELLPGRNMTLTGKVHGNKDIYIAGDYLASLTIDAEYLRSAGHIYNMRKDSDRVPDGSVRIKIKDSSDYAYMKEGGDTEALDSRRSDWASTSQSRWGGSVMSGVHGVTSLAAPEIASTQPDGYYATQADLYITNNSAHEGGSVLVEGVDIPTGTFTVSDSFYNHREGKYIKTTNIDVLKLAGWEQQLDGEGQPMVDGEGNPVYAQNYPNHLPADGLLYATRDDVEETKQGGIRLLNGSWIDNTNGLTAVSEFPIYIQGDFNTVNKKKAAIICDAAHIVSNNWVDANSQGAVDSRK